jgi:hypothetical protein
MTVSNLLFVQERERNIQNTTSLKNARDST